MFDLNQLTARGCIAGAIAWVVLMIVVLLSSTSDCPRFGYIHCTIFDVGMWVIMSVSCLIPANMVALFVSEIGKK